MDDTYTLKTRADLVYRSANRDPTMALRGRSIFLQNGPEMNTIHSVVRLRRISYWLLIGWTRRKSDWLGEGHDQRKVRKR